MGTDAVSVRPSKWGRSSVGEQSLETRKVRGANPLGSTSAIVVDIPGVVHYRDAHCREFPDGVGRGT